MGKCGLDSMKQGEKRKSSWKYPVKRVVAIRHGEGTGDCDSRNEILRDGFLLKRGKNMRMHRVNRMLREMA